LSKGKIKGKINKYTDGGCEAAAIGVLKIL